MALRWTRGHAPELLGEGAIVVPARLRNLKAERLVGAVGALGEGVRGEDEVGAGILRLQPVDEGRQHAPADPAALVLGRHVHGPEIESGAVVQVDGDPADGGIALAGDEVAVWPRLAGAGEVGPGAHRIAQVAEVEGVVGKAAFAPLRQLRDKILVPRA